MIKDATTGKLVPASTLLEQAEEGRRAAVLNGYFGLKREFEASWSEETQKSNENVKQQWEKAGGVDAVFASPKKLKKLIRKGIPNNLRRQVYLRLTGADVTLKERPKAYEKALIDALGSELRTVDLDKCPKFAGVLSFGDHYVRADGQEALSRLLCAVFQRFPECEYAPILLDMAQLFLLHLNENECYHCLAAVIVRAKEDRFFLTTNKTRNILFMETFKDLVREKVSSKLSKHFLTTGRKYSLRNAF